MAANYIKSQFRSFIIVTNGLLFLFSAMTKAIHPGTLNLSLGHLFSRLGLRELRAGWPLYFLIAALIMYEIALGGLLLSGFKRRLAYRLLIGTLLVFTVYLTALVFDPAAPPCACFGAIRLAADARTENLISFGKDLVLLAALFASGDGARPCSNSIAFELSSTPTPAA